MKSKGLEMAEATRAETNKIDKLQRKELRVLTDKLLGELLFDACDDERYDEDMCSLMGTTTALKHLLAADKKFNGAEL